jgi:anti-sigma factor RsiW
VTCQEFVELVTAYLEDALDAFTRTRFEEHLAECQGCDRYLDQIRVTIATLGELPPETLPDQARDHLLAAFRTWRR